MADAWEDWVPQFLLFPILQVYVFAIHDRVVSEFNVCLILHNTLGNPGCDPTNLGIILVKICRKQRLGHKP